MSLPGQSTFISYCRDDTEFALRLAADLKAAGTAVWIDQIDIAFGEQWDVAVERALLSAPRILVILSPASVASSNVLDEVSFALSKKKTVIPVLYRECELPFRLHRLQHLDFRSSYDRGLKALVEALAVAAADFSQRRPAGTLVVETHPPFGVEESVEPSQSRAENVAGHQGQERTRLDPNQVEFLRLAEEANERAARDQAERDRLAALQAEAKRLAKKKAADRLAKERAAEAEIRAREKAAAEAEEKDRRAREKAAAERLEAPGISGDKAVANFLPGTVAAAQSPEEKAEVERRRYELDESIRKSKAAPPEKKREPWHPKAALRAGEEVQTAVGGSVKVGGRWVARTDAPKLSRAESFQLWLLIALLVVSLVITTLWIISRFS